ncbi:hypothetical protein THAOC_30296, partial [Thalassiosira oceanica]
RQGQLGRWVHHQSSAYTAKSLAQDRIDQLNSIGFDWTLYKKRSRKRKALPSTQEQSSIRNESVSLLGTNVELGGNMPAGDKGEEAAVAEPAHGANAPAKTPSAIAPRKTPPTAAEPPASATRKLVAVAGYGKPPAAPVASKPAMLAANGKTAPQVPWETRFNELVNYRSEHGDCNVPVKGDKLGSWVRKQRRAYVANSLAQDRIDRLNSIGFKWRLKATRDSGPRVPWETRFDELIQHKANHGDCNVPLSQGQLGTWVSTQRVAYKKNKLLQDRLDRLNGIGFDWTPPMLRPRKRKALPSTQGQSSIRNECVSLLGANVESASVAAGARYFESNGLASCFESIRFKVGDCAPGPALLLPAPSNNSSHSHGTESDEKLDEIEVLLSNRRVHSNFSL